MEIHNKIYGSYYHDSANVNFDTIATEGADEVHVYINKDYLIECLTKRNYSSINDVYKMINNL